MTARLAPEDKRNAAVIERYQANILRVVPELKYHPAREFAIDLVLFINGLPVATVELKTDFTQSCGGHGSVPIIACHMTPRPNAGNRC
jgi:type I site-specific restriction-modification system R (restriction) subunit